ncbi:MAG: DUF2846 domain-containing protein [Verrucomicrobiae bacterium]|nr:DUF2846 domain-containing protein [Verrucomicrobiae bacterium]
MKRINTLFLVAACTAMLSGCATGKKFSEARSTLPPLAADQGRIFFYRVSAVGAAVQPAVKLNGEKIGTAKPKGVFFADCAPGNYQVETSTEVKRQLSLTLEKQQIRYVRLNVSLGFFVGHVFPELVENSVGEQEAAKCKFIETK